VDFVVATTFTVKSSAVESPPTVSN
jgi:hypothetical protein